MKKTLLSILTLFLTVSYANAQFIIYKDDSGWNLGLNIYLYPVKTIPEENTSPKTTINNLLLLFTKLIKSLIDIF